MLKLVAWLVGGGGSSGGGGGLDTRGRGGITTTMRCPHTWMARIWKHMSFGSKRLEPMLPGYLKGWVASPWPLSG
jgi:hypothetical protein